MSIIGNFIGMLSPRANYKQTDQTAPDYLEGREEILSTTGGTMTGALNTSGIILKQGVDYGDSLPSTVTSGKLFFKRVT